MNNHFREVNVTSRDSYFAVQMNWELEETVQPPSAEKPPSSAQMLLDEVPQCNH